MVRDLLILLTICSIIVSCDSKQPAPEIKDTTLILYIIANNNLEQHAECLLKEIEDIIGMKDDDSINLVVLYRARGKTLLLSNENQHLLQRKDYGDINSLSRIKMHDIIADIYKSFPSKEIGIVFWSHGTGWLSTGNNETRSFGDDKGESIDICDLATSLSIKFDYLIFDACYMGGIEVATELQNNCKYFIASPSTVPPLGIIDAKSISILIQNYSLQERLMDLCDYSHKSKDIPISLMDLDQLGLFIDSVKLLQIDSNCFSASDITVYDFRSNDIFFDMYSLFKNIDDYNVLASLNNMLLFPENVEKNGSVSIFIPTENNNSYWENYSKTQWNIRTSWLSKW